MAVLISANRIHLEKEEHEVWGAVMQEEIRGALHVNDN
jgi:hypothetical protein